MNFLDKYQNKILIGIWSAIVLTCLFVIFTEPVKAATSSSTEIPYNVAEMQSYNTIMLDKLDVALAKYFNDTGYDSSTPVMVWTNDGFFRNSFYEYYIMREPQLRSGYSYTEGYDFTSNKIYFSSSYQIVRIVVRTDNNPPEVQLNQGVYATLCGNASSVSTSIGSYLPLYPFYYNGEPLIDSNNDTEVFISRVSGGGVSVTGHATEPINDPDNIIDDGSGNVLQRPTKPTPTPFTPNPFNPPSIDTSTLETLVESLIDVVEYGFNYLGGVISGTFSNLLFNLGSWFDYIVQSFSYGFNNVVKAIQNLATDFYNNMVSLFEPLYDFFNGVATFFNNLIQLGMDGENFSFSTFIYNLIVPDADDLASSLVEHDDFGFIPLVNALKTKVTSVYDSIFNLSATKIFTLPSFTAFGVTFPSYQMDFSWFDDYKVYSDAIISGFLVIGYFHWLFITISSHIRGGSVIAGDVTVPDKKGGH